MKKLFIAALLFVGIVSFAQDINQKPAHHQKENLTPEQRTEKHLQKLTSELSLDKKQQEQVKQLLAERSAKAEKFKASRKDSNVKPTDAEKEAFKKQMETEKAANDAKMKAILNADQYTKWTALKKDHKGKHDHKSSQERDQAHLQKLTTDLNLNADQQKQVTALLSERSTKMEMLKKSRKDGVAPTTAEKEAMKKQMAEDHKATDAKMKSILNADQYKKWTAIQKEHKDKMKDHRKDKM
jgi:septal ring factor EnvC (AmiA/AmiB activator)